MPLDYGFIPMPRELALDYDVSDGAARLYAYLMWRQGANSCSWPSLARMAADLDVTEMTVKRRLRCLVAAGWMQIRARPMHSNAYTVFTAKAAVRQVREWKPAWDEEDEAAAAVAVVPEVEIVNVTRGEQKCSPELDSQNETQESSIDKNLIIDKILTVASQIAPSVLLREEHSQLDSQDSRFSEIGSPRKAPPGKERDEGDTVSEDIGLGGDEYLSLAEMQAGAGAYREPTSIQVAHQAMVTALLRACRYDEKLKRRDGRVNRAAKRLREVEYTPAQIDAGYGPGGWWWSHHPVGRRNRPPIPEQIIDTILEAVQFAQGAEPVHVVEVNDTAMGLNPTGSVVEVWDTARGTRRMGATRSRCPARRSEARRVSR